MPTDRLNLRILEVLLVAGATSTLCYLITVVSPCAVVPPTAEFTPSLNGTLAPSDYEEFSSAQIEEDFFRRLNCPPGRYNIGGQLFFTPLSEALKLLLHLGEAMFSGTYRFAFGVVLLFFLSLYSLMTWTYGIAAPSGLFVPSLAVGAALGQICGLAVERALAALGSDIGVDLHAYAIVGAAAMLGGATRMTISITLLVTETTGALQMLVPLMVTIAVSKAVGDRLGRGIYDAHIHLRRVPFLEEFNPDDRAAFGAHEDVSLAELRDDRAVRRLPARLKAARALEALEETGQQHFIVVASGEKTLGTIGRARLVKMLVSGNLGTLPSSGEELERVRDALADIPNKAAYDEGRLRERAAARGLLAEEVDLRELVTPPGLCFRESASAAQAYEAVRKLGLPFVTVLSKEGDWLLTRADLLRVPCVASEREAEGA